MRNERGEGRGEGHPTADTPAHLQARQPSSPQPSPPSAGGEGEEFGALNTYTGGEGRGEGAAPADGKGRVQRVEFLTPEKEQALDLEFEQVGPRLRFRVPEFLVYGVVRIQLSKSE